MTDPTGRCFISYRRARADDAELLVHALHDHGIPTWQDRSNLRFENTEDEIRRVLANPNTSSAVMLITQEVAESAFIRNVEVPDIMRRTENQDGFFLLAVPIGLDYKTAAEAVESSRVAHDILVRKMRQVLDSPLTEGSAAQIARDVLEQRLAAIHRSLPRDEPLRLGFYAFPGTKAPVVPGVALTVDWSSHFPRRECPPETWNTVLLPALQAVANTIRTQAPPRPVEAFGLAVLPAAAALGRAFSATSGLRLRWRQTHHDTGEQLWSLEAPHEPSGFEYRLTSHEVDKRDLAVLVSVTQDVEPAFSAFRSSLPPLRAILRIRKPGGLSHLIRSPGAARDVADVVREGLIQARQQYGSLGTIHLFMAVPVGIAVLIGQNLNTFGSVQTYEHLPTDGDRYCPAARLSLV